MKEKEILKSQYSASLEMLRQAILSCPDPLWHSPKYTNQFWHIAYHAIFYTHFYLHSSEEAFVPWEKHHDELVSLESGQEEAGEHQPYSKEELLAYLDLCQTQMPGQVEALDLAGESGFYWLPFDMLEIQLYNIRHVMQHTGELCERLGAHGDIEIGWVEMKPAG